MTDPSGLDSFLPVQRPLSQAIQRGLQGLRGHAVHPGLHAGLPHPSEAVLHFSQAPSGEELPATTHQLLREPWPDSRAVPQPLPCPQPAQGAPRVFTASMPPPRPFLCLGHPLPPPPPNWHLLPCKAQPSVTTPGKLFSAPGGFIPLFDLQPHPCVPQHVLHSSTVSSSPISFHEPMSSSRAEPGPVHLPSTRAPSTRPGSE